MTTQFTTTVKTSGGDFSNLNAAVTKLANDITLSTIKVFSISTYTTPTIAAEDTILGQTSGATGICVLVNMNRTQILIKDITGTFYIDEIIQKISDANVNVKISDYGDSPIIGIECYSMTDTVPVTITNYITNYENYIIIYTPFTDRHDGKWNDTKYKLTTLNVTPLIITDVEYIRIDGLQIEVNVTTSYKHGIRIRCNEPCDIQISNNIIKGNLTNLAIANSGIYCAYFISGTRSVKIWNNIIYNFINKSYDEESYGIKMYNGYIAKIYNNTVYGNFKGISSDGNASDYAINNLSYNNTYNYIGKFNSLSTNNLSGSQQTNAPGLNPRNGPDMFVTFIDEVNNDFHLDLNDIGAKNYGIDISGDVNLSFSTDIDNQTRPSNTWDIGADQTSLCQLIQIKFNVV